MIKINPSEITLEHVYISRRRFMVGIGALVTSSLVLSACGQGRRRLPTPPPTPTSVDSSVLATPSPDVSASPSAPPDISETPQASVSPVLSRSPERSEGSVEGTDELGDKLTSFEAISSYTNYYEFTTSKEGVARLAQNFRTSPWTVEVGGLVHKPKTFDLDDLLRFSTADRIHRLRCVQAWSMVIPWFGDVGLPLAKLLKEVEPMSKAKYVRFETHLPSGSDAWPKEERVQLALCRGFGDIAHG